MLKFALLGSVVVLMGDVAPSGGCGESEPYHPYDDDVGLDSADATDVVNGPNDVTVASDGTPAPDSQADSASTK